MQETEKICGGSARDRAVRLVAAFETRWTGKYTLFSSPGRAELLGNHTDHNRGRAIVAPVARDILLAAQPREGEIVIESEKFAPVRISLSDGQAREKERGKSASLVRGVVAYLRSLGFEAGGFSAVTDSSLFRGAGVSSSAAFSVLIAEVENVLYLGGALSPLQKAMAAQYAENNFFGKPCGLLDQYAIAFGGVRRIDFSSDPPASETLPFPKGFNVVLTNTSGSHAGLTVHYAAIRREMGQVASFFGKATLREIDKRRVMDALPALKKSVPERAILRALHFFEENERVDAAAKALKAGRTGSFLAQVQKSGESSLALLQNCYVPGSKFQPLALGCKLSESLLKGGASRMMGGGFTGTVLAFCPEGETERYCRGMGKVFGAENVICTQIRQTGTSVFTL